MKRPDPAGSASASPALAARSGPASWRLALPAVLLVLALILLVYRDTVSAMVGIWYRSETFTHAFVVPPITAWLIWRQRRALAALVPRPAFWVLLPIGAAVLSWLLGDLVAVNSVTQLALVALLVLSVPALLGPKVAHAIAFPLVFMFFAVPIGEFLLPQLMEWTATFTIAALRLTGVPVYREGLQFVIPSGNWSVIEACSGVRYLIASLTVGTLFAYLNYQSTQRRVLFVLVSILVPVIANWMRAYMIVMLGHLSGNKIAVGVDHLIYGWVFFGVVIMLMFIIGARWSEAEPAPGGASSLPTARLAPTSSLRMWAAMVCVGTVVALPPVAKSIIGRAGPVGAPALAAPVELASGWQAVNPNTSYRPAFRNPAAELVRSYGKSGQTVGLYLAYYRRQDYGSKLVSSDNVLVNSSDLVWSRVSGGARPANLGQQSATVQTAELRRLVPSAEPSEPERLLAWQIYWINGTLTSSDYLAKAYSAAYRLIGRGDDSAVIIVYAAKDPAGATDGLLESFVSANYDSIDTALRQAKASGN